MRTVQFGHLALGVAALVLLLLAQACGGEEARPEITVDSVRVGATLTDQPLPGTSDEIIATLRIHNPHDFAIATDTSGHSVPLARSEIINLPSSEPGVYNLRVYVHPSEPGVYNLSIEGGGTAVVEVVHLRTYGRLTDAAALAASKRTRDAEWRIDGFLMFRYPNKEELVCVAIPGSESFGGWPGACLEDPYVQEALKARN